MNDPPQLEKHRDAASLRVLGIFFLALGGLVFVGTFWTLDNGRAIVVNLASSAVLLAVGLGTILAGRRMARRHRNEQPEDSQTG